ncbi:MAG: acyloxyacyl hydrolase [Pseudomonadota bacterium]|nr:acyloxyacyl hydrolase [Pseudomonadota bacterium]|tara:strand:- start:797 stop:1372 length:576 start_codon:yes stop_codon:yes gene_type:complete
MSQAKYIFIFLLLCTSLSFAGDNIQSSSDQGKYFFGIGAGEGGGPYGGGFTAFRLSHQKILSRNSTYNFEYVSDLGVNFWKDNSRLNTTQGIHASSSQHSSNVSLTYSRLIRKYLTANTFLDTGFGLSLQSNDSIGGADLGSYYQIESRFGIGYERETYRSIINLYHYSNAGLENQNDGVNIIMLSVSKYF